ncbi:zinc-ribbon domain-containing protein [Pendulispora brunnea]|uniref:Zinc-ribbon domain-containing protein n=1 Tax=Pendulispora brunnea TaxID=2905690 RepID=A0ABZ2K240_9BACT
MKISCQSCQAKYTIADEKVLGKIVKIRCKKCGATIVINGNEPEATASSGGAASGGTVSDPGYSADQDQWTVNVADGDQRTMTVQEIVDEYKSGTIHDETFCWKDGMNDWLPLREIDSLYAACSVGSSPAVGEYSPLSLRNSGPDADPIPAPAAAAPAAASPLGLGGGFGGGDSLFGGASSPRANGNGSSGGLFDSNPLAAASSTASPLAAAGTSAAARRTGGRGNQADLFGGVSQAGGEEDVMTSAAPVSNDGSKLTGQRNENSVLFSLGALTQTSGPADKPRGSSTSSPSSSSSSVSDGSGLIDIRALASSTSSTESEGGAKGGRHVDDIMNLGGGGAFSAALAAPVLAPPPQDFGDLSSPVSMGGGQNRTLLIAIIVGTLLVCTAVIVAVIVTRPSVKEEAKPSEPTATVSASAVPAPAPTPTVAAADPASSPTASGAKEITPGAGTKGTGGGSRVKGSAGGGGGSTASTGGGEEGTAAPAPVAKKEGPADLAGAMQKAVGGHAEESAPSQAAASTAPFNRAEAAASLGNVNISSCKKSDGPTGSGHVKVTFQPSGTVSVVDVDQPPFTGTAVGGCIASKFRSAHVPPFGGAPVTVGKTFSLN